MRSRRSTAAASLDPADRPALAVHLLGAVDFETAWRLQQRLVFESTDRNAPQAWLLLAEHPTLVTVGRGGSWADVRFSADELAQRSLEVRWVNRGGGAMLHAPGQLAVYPILPLDACGLRVGDYLNQLISGLAAALAESGTETQTRDGERALWGRTGPLAAVGAAVRGGVSYFGAYLNVAPPMNLVRRVAGPWRSREPMSSLAVERRRPPRITTVRESVVRQVSTALGFERYHWNSGHPLLAPRPAPPTSRTARAG